MVPISYAGMKESICKRDKSVFTFLSITVAGRVGAQKRGFSQNIILSDTTRSIIR
jgi:hypothetical protein